MMSGLGEREGAREGPEGNKGSQTFHPSKPNSLFGTARYQELLASLKVCNRGVRPDVFVTVEDQMMLLPLHLQSRQAQLAIAGKLASLEPSWVRLNLSLKLRASHRHCHQTLPPGQYLMYSARTLAVLEWRRGEAWCQLLKKLPTHSSKAFKLEASLASSRSEVYLSVCVIFCCISISHPISLAWLERVISSFLPSSGQRCRLWLGHAHSRDWWRGSYLYCCRFAASG